jgi:hypothetical protein
MANKVQNSNNKSIIISSIVLAVVVIVTITLKLYTHSIVEENNKMDEQISEMRKEISEIKKDKLVSISEAVNANRNIIETKEKVSEIPKYYYSMKNLAKNYDLKVEGFNYEKGVINTQVTVKSDNEKTAQEKISTFLSEYRKTENAIFDVAFTRTFKGDDEIEFSLELKVK